MASYLSDAQKSGYASAFNRLHDTFAREVIVWKTPQKIILNTDPNYNFLYNDQEDMGYVKYVPVSGKFDCRIQWQDPAKLMGIPEIREEIRGNICRIKAKKDFVDFISDVERVEIDGRPVQPLGTSRPHGLFNIDFYTLYFKESE